MLGKTKKQMTRWGIGPRFTIVSLTYAIIIFVLEYISFLDVPIPVPRILSLVSGIILIVIGLPVFLIPAFTIDKHFKKGQLATKGVYGYLRHPIYASWIIFIVPGIVLIKNSFLDLTIPVFMYLIFSVMILEEEKYLEKKFGKEYIEYKKKVNAVFPKFF
jgi:protein-S-isoprenylcysteine O-methyltransferase Ste14